MSRSKKQTDWLGREYIQHYDDSGNKTGWSRTESGFFGGKYTQQYSESGEKEGYSEKETGLFRGEYVQHYSQAREKVGYSEDERTLLGGYRQTHHGQDGHKQGYSTFETGLFGGAYKQHHGVGKGRPTSTGPTGGSAPSPRGSGAMEGGVGVVIFLLVIGVAIVIAILSVVSNVPSTKTQQQRAPAQQQFSNKKHPELLLRQSTSTPPRVARATGHVGLPSGSSESLLRALSSPSGLGTKTSGKNTHIDLNTKDRLARDNDHRVALPASRVSGERGLGYSVETTRSHLSGDGTHSYRALPSPASPSPITSHEHAFVIPPKGNRYMSNAVYYRCWEKNLACRQSR